jgi:hypothetical protein
MASNTNTADQLKRDGYIDEEIPAGINLIEEINRMKKKRML